MTPAVADHLDLAGKVSLAPIRLSVREAVEKLFAGKTTIRQERISGIHNPWGHCIGLTDPWSFLELCESGAIIDAAQKVIGPDIILWDSELFETASRYGEFLSREGRYWPVTPLAGAVVLVSASEKESKIKAFRLEEITSDVLAGFDASNPLYVIRLIPATSQFQRDPNHPANRACMEERVLVNYSNRPLWLLSGVDRARNDLVSGFAPAVPIWASGAMPSEGKEK